MIVARTQGVALGFHRLGFQPGNASTVLCISLTVFYAAVYSIVAATPRIISLADLSHEPPVIMKSVPIVSRVIPLVFFVLTVTWVYKTSTAFRGNDGIFRVIHKSEKDMYL